MEGTPPDRAGLACRPPAFATAASRHTDVGHPSRERQGGGKDIQGTCCRSDECAWAAGRDRRVVDPELDLVTDRLALAGAPPTRALDHGGWKLGLGQ